VAISDKSKYVRGTFMKGMSKGSYLQRMQSNMIHQQRKVSRASIMVEREAEHIERCMARSQRKAGQVVPNPCALYARKRKEFGQQDQGGRDLSALFLVY
jgi:hypothetical protein